MTYRSSPQPRSKFTIIKLPISTYLTGYLIVSQYLSDQKSSRSKMMLCSRLGLLRMTTSMTPGLARRKHTLPSLPYGYKDLEPVISAEIMELHHSKHHATYVNNLNTAEDQLKEYVERGM